MNPQTKDALERVEKFLDSRSVSRNLDQEQIHAHDDNPLLGSDLRQLIRALSVDGELFRYSEWLDSQQVIRDDTPVLDDSGNETGEIDTRSHEQLVRDYLKEA